MIYNVVNTKKLQMKLKLLPLLVSILTAPISFSQSSYQYYYGYVDGYHKACDCNKNIEKKTSLLYHTGTYSEGYDAGFVDGRIYASQNQSKEENNSYQPNYELIQSALAKKQALLNERRNQLQYMYDAVINLYGTKVTEHGLTNTESRKEYMRHFDSEIRRVDGEDLTNNALWNEIVSFCKKAYAEVDSWKN